MAEYVFFCPSHYIIHFLSDIVNPILMKILCANFYDGYILFL